VRESACEQVAVGFGLTSNYLRKAKPSKCELASTPNCPNSFCITFLFSSYHFFSTDNFPPKIVNVSREINVTLYEILHLNISAEDNDAITFQVINKPPDATKIQTGNVLYFSWNVTSTQKVNCIKKQ